MLRVGLGVRRRGLVDVHVHLAVGNDVEEVALLALARDNRTLREHFLVERVRELLELGLREHRPELRLLRAVADRDLRDERDVLGNARRLEVHLDATVRLARDLPQLARARGLDRRGARRAVHERELAERAARRERTHVDVARAAAAHRDRDLTFLDHVKVVAHIALLDDHLARGRGACLERIHEGARLVGRRRREALFEQLVRAEHLAQHRLDRAALGVLDRLPRLVVVEAHVAHRAALVRRAIAGGARGRRVEHDVGDEPTQPRDLLARGLEVGDVRRVLPLLGRRDADLLLDLGLLLGREQRGLRARGRAGAHDTSRGVCTADKSRVESTAPFWVTPCRLQVRSRGAQGHCSTSS